MATEIKLVDGEGNFASLLVTMSTKWAVNMGMLGIVVEVTLRRCRPIQASVWQ